MAKTKDKLKGVLSALSEEERLYLTNFLKFLHEKRKFAHQKGDNLLDLPLKEFEKIGVQIDIGVVCGVLKDIYKTIYIDQSIEKGISHSAPPPPKLVQVDGEWIVKGLMRVPIEDLVDGLYKVGDKPYSFGGRIPVHIDSKVGISSSIKPNVRCEITPNQMKILMDIILNKKPKDRGGYPGNLTRSIGFINDVFCRKFDVLDPLVDHTKTYGYFINETSYHLTYDFSHPLK